MQVVYSTRNIRPQDALSWLLPGYVDDHDTSLEERKRQTFNCLAVWEEVVGRVEVRAGVRADGEGVDVREVAFGKAEVEGGAEARVAGAGGDLSRYEGMAQVDDCAG